MKLFLLFWMCDLVALTQQCKLISFLYLIYNVMVFIWYAFGIVIYELQ